MSKDIFLIIEKTMENKGKVI